MNRGVAVVIAVLLAFGLSVLPVAAQQSPPGRPSIPGETQGMPGGSMQGMPGGPQGMMGGTMMCPMMMSMMGRQADPRLLQMHGEMMKALGDIMMKYGKTLEETGTR